MKKLGILTHQILNSQKCSSLMVNLNNLCNHDKNLDIILFYNDLGKTQYINQFAIMQSIEALDYDGTVVATDIVSACILSKCICAKKKYFYVWDINWNIQNKNIDFMKDIYMNNEISLIARSQYHANLIKRLFKEPEYIIEDFNYEQLQNIV